MKLFGVVYGKFADKFAIVQADNKFAALNILANSTEFLYQHLEVDRDIGYAVPTEIKFDTDNVLVVYDGDIG